MTKLSLRLLLAIPLFYFIYQGKMWAVCAMFLLQYIGYEIMAGLLLRLSQRNLELCNLIRQRCPDEDK